MWFLLYCVTFLCQNDTLSVGHYVVGVAVADDWVFGNMFATLNILVTIIILSAILMYSNLLLFRFYSP